MRFSADLRMTRMGTGGYLRQTMVQKPAHHHRTFEQQSQGKARACEDDLVPRGFSASTALKSSHSGVTVRCNSLLVK
jgi:hypothetical protein